MNTYIAQLYTPITDEEKLTYLIADVWARISSIQMLANHNLKDIHPDQFRLVCNTVRILLQKMQEDLLAIERQKAHRDTFQKDPNITLGMENITEQIGCILQISALTSDIEDLYDIMNIGK